MRSLHEAVLREADTRYARYSLGQPVEDVSPAMAAWTIHAISWQEGFDEFAVLVPDEDCAQHADVVAEATLNQYYKDMNRG